MGVVCLDAKSKEAKMSRLGSVGLDPGTFGIKNGRVTG